MPAVRKRENRENQFYNVGEQGRKTGIRLEDKGVRDEYGMEPVSGIFSSPEKSPPKRSAAGRRTGGTVTDSESMDIQESSIPDLTPGHILKNSRTNLPPPRSRSPMKTALGATPRRSMGPRGQSVNKSASPDHGIENSAVSRRLDFDQGESSLQETPALSGSGTRRGMARRNIYDVEQSPIPAISDSDMVNGFAEETGEDAMGGAIGADESLHIEESSFEAVVAEQPLRKGRKRKSDAIEPAAENTSPATQPKKTRTVTTEKAKKTIPPPTAKARGRPPRPMRGSDATGEGNSSMVDASVDDSIQVEEPAAPAPTKARGRRTRPRVDLSADVSNPPEEPPSFVVPKGRGAKAKAQADTSADSSELVENAPATATKRRGRPPFKNQASQTAPVTEAAADQPIFKKPKAVSKQKSSASEKPLDGADPSPKTLVDTLGKPLSKADIDQMSTTSAGSRFKRGRSLSVFRQLRPEEASSTLRTGRHHVKPVNFWMNERAAYDRDGTLLAVLQNESVEEEPRKRAGSSYKRRGKKGALAAIEEDDEYELEDWEVNEGVFVGPYRDFDPATETMSDEQFESELAWAESGIKPQQVPNAQFKFTKLGSAGARSFFSWGCIELDEDDIKRSKNSRRMHMAFHVTKGAVEVNVNDNVFTVHKGGVWQVPRGNNYSIRNVAKKESRVFFAQAFESTAQDED